MKRRLNPWLPLGKINRAISEICAGDSSPSNDLELMIWKSDLTKLLVSLNDTKYISRINDQTREKLTLFLNEAIESVLPEIDQYVTWHPEIGQSLIAAIETKKQIGFPVFIKFLSHRKQRTEIKAIRARLDSHLIPFVCQELECWLQKPIWVNREFLYGLSFFCTDWIGNPLNQTHWDGHSYDLSVALGLVSLIIGQPLPDSTLFSAELTIDGHLEWVANLEKKVIGVIEEVPQINQTIISPFSSVNLDYIEIIQKTSFQEVLDLTFSKECITADGKILFGLEYEFITCLRTENQKPQNLLRVSFKGDNSDKPDLQTALSILKTVDSASLYVVAKSQNCFIVVVDVTNPFLKMILAQAFNIFPTVMVTEPGAGGFVVLKGDSRADGFEPGDIF